MTDVKITNQEKSNEQPKAAEILLQLIDEASFEFFHDEHEDAFCKYPSLKPNVFEVRRIHDAKFKSYLSLIYRRAEGKTIGESALKEALSEIEGRALYDTTSKKEKIFLRCGEMNGKLYIDLCNESWQVLEISIAGWKVLESRDVPIKFERSRHALSLPNPNEASTGDISKLWDLINVPKEDQILILTYILECYRSTTAFPILTLLGSQDAGKSATQNTIRSLVDPSTSNLRTAPRKADDLAVDAASNWLVSYNNLSHLSDEMHDDFCCISTGSGFATRKHYTNTEQIVINISRPVAINGISNFIRRPDLLDRAIILELNSIDESKRKTDSELHTIMRDHIPSIFRGLIDLLVNVLKALPEVKLDKKPRMADFALLGIAVEKVLRYQEGTFMGRYRNNRASAKDSILDCSPIMLALIDFIEQQENQFWRGRPSDLLEVLTKFKRPQPNITWPKTPQAMGGELKRYTASLIGVGIEIVKESQLNGMKNRDGNIYRIHKNTDAQKTSPQYPHYPHSDTNPYNHTCEPVDIDVGISIEESTQTPHTLKPENPHDTYIPDETVEFVDIADLKNMDLNYADEHILI